MKTVIREANTSFNLLEIYKEVFRYKSFLLNLTQRELEIRYKGSVLGVAWSILNPLLSLVVYFVIFKKLSGSNIPNFLIYLFSGTTAWLFFQQTLNLSSNLLLHSANIMSKTYFPLEVLALSNVIAQLVNYLICFALVLVVMLLTRSPFSWNMLWVPLIVALQTIFLYSCNLLLSSVGTIVRDLNQIVITLLSLLFFVTPIFYKPEFITSNPKLLFVLNHQPIAAIISLYRNVLHQGTHPDWNMLAYVGVMCFLFYLLCHFIFHKLRGVVYDLI